MGLARLTYTWVRAGLPLEMMRTLPASGLRLRRVQGPACPGREQLGVRSECRS